MEKQQLSGRWVAISGGGTSGRKAEGEGGTAGGVRESGLADDVRRVFQGN